MFSGPRIPMAFLCTLSLGNIYGRRGRGGGGGGGGGGGREGEGGEGRGEGKGEGEGNMEEGHEHTELYMCLFDNFLLVSGDFDVVNWRAI